MVESSSSDGSDSQNHSDDDAATNGASVTGPSNNGGRRSHNRRNGNDAGISRSGQATTNHNAGHHRQGNADGGGRLGGTGSNSARLSRPTTNKRLIDSPASAAGTGSTCSLSTAASHGLGVGSISGSGGGAAGAILGGRSMAVGTLSANEHTPGRGGMNLNSRHGKHHQSRQERRALRRRQRRGNRNQRNQTPTAVLRQLQAMSSTLGVSFGLFLLFYLNLPALFFLMTTLAVGALTAMIGYQYLILQYNAVLSSGGFIQFLPEGVQESLRDALEGTTLHQWMTDPAFFMEYRYLALYFIPGLDADQLNALVDRLPERHRRVLRRPGYMSSVTPASVRRVLIADDDGEDDGGLGDNAATFQALPGPSSGENSSIGLNDRTSRQLFEDDDGGTDVGDENVNNADTQYEPSTTELWADIAATITSVLQGSAVGQATLGAIQEEDDDCASSDAGSLVIERLPSDGGSSDDDESVPTGQLENSIPPTVTTMARQTAMPQTPPPSQSAEEEQQIEGDILSDAAAEMSRHYLNAAASTARDAFDGAVEFLTPGVVRLGLGTSIFSGFGLFGSYYINFVRGHPLGWRRPLPRLTGNAPSGGGSSSSDGIAGDQGDTISETARFVTYGLLSSAFLGGATAGLMLLLRNAVRRSNAAERAKIEGEGKRSKGGKNG